TPGQQQRQHYSIPPHQPQTYHIPNQRQSYQQQPSHDRQSSNSSPYNIPEPTQTHPAYYAQVADPTAMHTPRSRPGSVQPVPQSPGPEPPLTRPHRVSTMPIRTESDEKAPHPTSPPAKRTSFTPYSPTAIHPPNRANTQPVFAATSLTGPNGLSPEQHQPGQVAHPNMLLSPSIKGKWQHSLCECNADVGTCLTGIFCPCILDSKTAYRLEKRSSKKDPSDMLGFSSCNGRCGVMTVFGICGIGIFPLTLRTRIRHSYQLSGSLGSDILHSCCCCCCVAIQNEREVREREEKLRQNAGPAAASV
ncbi:PLAC8-domain-containing protein, partial [Tothia fuscella]